MHTDRVQFLDLYFDRISFSDVKARLRAATGTSPFECIVTPNVDHVVRVHREPRLKRLYDSADLCVCDSRVLKFLARLRGIDLPLVAGSDLTAALFTDVLAAGDCIAIVGAESSSVEQLRRKFPAVKFLHLEAPMDLRSNSEARHAAAAFIAESRARFALIAVGSPQQEMIAQEVRKHASATGVALCIGAGLDFVIGKQKRAPKFVQIIGLEWAYRLLSNPRRLWRRYLVEGVRIFPIWLRWRAPHARSILVVWMWAMLPLAAAALYAALSYGPDRSTGAPLNLWPTPTSAKSAAVIEALPPPNLLKPVTPEQAAEQNSERPFVSRRDGAASRFVLHTDDDDRARALTCLTEAVYYEAASEGVDGGRAVAQVVLNRLRHPGFPSTICGVVNEGAERWLWARSKQIADEALEGRVFAPVGHATHYHADYVLPYWADSLDKSVQIGRHIFYRLHGSYGEARAFSQRYRGTELPFREPGATIVIPQTPEGEQVAKTLLSDNVVGGAKQDEQTPAIADTPLLIDSFTSTLLIDGQAPPQPAQHKKLGAKCPTSDDAKRLTPLGATDMRSSSEASAC